MALAVGSSVSTKRARYKIVKSLNPGSRGQTYIAKVTKRDAGDSPIPDKGTQVVIKTVRIEEERGPHSTAFRSDFVDRRLNEEARALARLRDLHCVAQYIDAGTLSTGDVVEPRFLVQQFIVGKVLSDALTEKYGKPFRGIPKAANWFRLSVALAEVLLAVHQRGVVHNDIWPANIMLNADGQPVLIDFGEAVLRSARELAFVDHTHRKDPWIDPEWRVTHLRPSRRADIFALGGVLFWMACGQEPPMPEHDIERAKVDIETAIAANNEPLLAENVAIADIIARCRRYDRAQRIANAEKLRRELLAFSPEATAADPVAAAAHITKEASSLAGSNNVFMARMAGTLLREAERQLEDMQSGIIEISGNHEDLVTGCVDALASLKAGDKYFAISALKFWKPDNIGIRGRYLSMTQLCAQRGVKIQRVFLLTETDKRDAFFWPVMRAQLALQNTENLETRFLFLTPGEFAERMEKGDHCGYWISGSEVMGLVPVYDNQDVLRSIRLIGSDVPTPARVHKTFERDFERATPLTIEALTAALSE